ncbi:MAG: ATP-grasp domain-containing protein [Xanthobacteraceae bacterium]
MIVIVSAPDDIHALSVCKQLNENSPEVDVAVFDSATFPLRASIELRLSNWLITDSDGRRISSRDVTALWWRRARSHDISDKMFDPAARRFVVNECSQAFNSIASWPTYLAVNNFERERIASLKPLQLAIALESGLKVPDTLITNDPIAVEEFTVSGRNVVFKSLTPPISTFGETRRYKPEHHEKLSSLQHAPVIFQSEIEKRRDVRVTVVGNEIFAAAIEHNNPVATGYPDWRLDASAECQLYELPEKLKKQIIVFMNKLGLLYGAIDLIETPGGELIFLEVNPSGQFLFVEVDTGLQISGAFARLLKRGLGGGGMDF